MYAWLKLLIPTLVRDLLDQGWDHSHRTWHKNIMSQYKNEGGGPRFYIGS